MVSKIAKKVADEKGGFLDISGNDLPWKETFQKLATTISQSIADALKHFRNPGYDIELVFYEDIRFNAFSWIDGKKCVIGISAAVIPLLLNICKSTVTNGVTVFPVQLESLKFNERSAYELLLDEKLYRDIEEPNAQFTLDSVMKIALDIIISHELCHIMNGHTGWRANVFGLNYIEEISDETNETDPLVMQTLEWDADTIGIQRSFLRAIGVTLPDVNGLNSKVRFEPPPYGPYGTYQQCVYAFTVALASTVSFFEHERDEHVRDHANSTGNYAPSWYRKSTAYLAVYHCIDIRIVPLSEVDTSIPPSESDHFPVIDHFLGPFFRGLADVDKAWLGMHGTGTGFTKITEVAKIKRLEELTVAYHAKWKEIWPELYNHKLIASAWDSF